MATYKEIQSFVKANYGFIPKTCWIAHVKEIEGLPIRRAWNRKSKERQDPCPSDKIGSIRDALFHFNMI